MLKSILGAKGSGSGLDGQFLPRTALSVSYADT